MQYYNQAPYKLFPMENMTHHLFLKVEWSVEIRCNVL